MTDLVPIESTEVIDPHTGGLIDVSDPATAAAFLDALRQSKHTIDSVISQVTEIVTREFERQGTRTINAGRYELEQKETASYEWDLTILVGLLDAGLPPDRYAEFVNETVIAKPKQSIAKQLETNPAYKEIIEQARRRVVKGTRVDVRVAKGAIEQ